jgi:chromosome segregation ATPase
MGDEWENVVIETGVDTLLNYLAENGDTTVSTISEDLGVSEDRIKQWAKALEDNDFVERTYSARKGMILQYTKENNKAANEKLKKVKEDVEKETKKVQNEMKSRDSEIKKTKKQLKKMAEELEDNREEEDKVKQNLEELEELEEELQEKLEEQKHKEEKLHQNSIQLISRIDNALNRIDEAEEKADRFEEKGHKLRTKMKALSKLKKHTDKVEDLDRELKQFEEKESEAKGLFSSFTSKIGSIFSSSEDYEKILDGSVKDVKQRVKSADDLDISKMAELEKSGKDRKTLNEFLERRIKNE